MRRAVTVKRAIERRVANPLSRRILAGEFKEGETAIGLRRCRVRLRQEGSAPQARESGGSGGLTSRLRARKRAVATATALLLSLRVSPGLRILTTLWLNSNEIVIFC